jgi:hypothetical protein
MRDSEALLQICWGGAWEKADYLVLLGELGKQHDWFYL